MSARNVFNVYALIITEMNKYKHSPPHRPPLDTGSRSTYI